MLQRVIETLFLAKEYDLFCMFCASIQDYQDSEKVQKEEDEQVKE